MTRKLKKFQPKNQIFSSNKIWIESIIKKLKIDNKLCFLSLAWLNLVLNNNLITHTLFENKTNRRFFHKF